MDVWAYKNKIKLDFIRPGKPVENAYIESFNGKVRDELLNTEVFESITEAQAKLEAWRNDYNMRRPHKSLNYSTPSEFAASVILYRYTPGKCDKLSLILKGRFSILYYYFLV